MMARNNMEIYLRELYKEHYQIWHDCYYWNLLIINPVLIVVFTCNLCINIFMITMLVYENINKSAEILFMSLCFVQITLIFSLTELLIYWSKSLYLFDINIYKTQLYFYDFETHRILYRTLQSKLKLNTFYEIIQHHNIFHFSTGPKIYLTNNSIFRFFLAYSSYLLLSFSLSGR